MSTQERVEPSTPQHVVPEIDANVPLGDVPPDAGAEAISPKLIASRSRCPYCHEDVRAERLDWVACEGCLARHHQTCWNERGSCASCHARGSLAPPRRARRALVALLAVAGLVWAGGLGFVLGRAHAPPGSNEGTRDESPKDAPPGYRVKLVRIEERKRAYEIFALDEKSETPRIRADYGEKLLDVARSYAQYECADDARRVQDAADALVRGDRPKALELLGLTAAPTELEREIEIAKARAMEKHARGVFSRIENGIAGISEGEEATKELLEAATLYQKLGLKEDAARIVAEVSPHKTEKTPAKPPARSP
jgi:hypothetical protein